MTKPKVLYFLQRGHGSGSTKFGVAETAEGQGGLLSMEVFAESIGTNLAESETDQRIILDWEGNKAVIQSRKTVETSYLPADLQAYLGTGFSVIDPSNGEGLLVCKYD